MNKHLCYSAALIVAIFELGVFTLACIIACKEGLNWPSAIMITSLVLVALIAVIVFICYCRRLNKTASEERRYEHFVRLFQNLMVEAVRRCKGTSSDMQNADDTHCCEIMDKLQHMFNRFFKCFKESVCNNNEDVD